jgi:predicted glycosyltransferase
LADGERRALVHGALAGVVEGFAPDVLVADTFPQGPHGELAGIGRHAKRVLVRRAVPDERADLLATGAGDYDLAIVAGDPGPLPVQLPVRTASVPPITLDAPALARSEARAVLGLPADGRAIIVAAGGGGDLEAVARAQRLAERIAEHAPDTRVVLARGPLSRAPAAALARVGEVACVPLAPVLRAFDGAVVPAGYNTAHELAGAGVPAVLFAQPRPFDDQAARAARFAAAGYAHALERDDDLPAALAWLASARISPLVADGAAHAAGAIFALMGAPR